MESLSGEDSVSTHGMRKCMDSEQVWTLSGLSGA